MRTHPISPGMGLFFVVVMGAWATCSERGLLDDGNAVDRWIRDQTASMEVPDDPSPLR